MPPPLKLSRARKRRAWRSLPPWARRGLIALYAVSCFFLGSAYIYNSGLTIAHTVQLLATPQAVTGQPFVMHARVDLPAAGDASLTVSLYDRDGTTVLASAQLGVTAGASRRAEGTVLLEIPEGLEARPDYLLQVDLESEGSPIKGMQIPFEVVTAEDYVAPPQLAAVGAPPDRQLLIELIPAGGALVDGYEKRVHVRVTDPHSGVPVPAAALSIKTDADGKKNALMATPVLPTTLVTNALGVATLSVLSRTEVDWTIDATAPDGRSYEQIVRLGVRVGSVQLDLPNPVYVPGLDEPLTATLHGARPRPFVLDLQVEGSWVASASYPKTGEVADVEWRPTLKAPSKPMLATLSACYTQQGCRRDHTHTALMLAPKAMGRVELLKTWLELLRPVLPEHEAGYWRAVSNLWEAEGFDADQLEIITDLLRATTPAPFTPTKGVFDSNPELKVRFARARSELRSQLNMIAFIILITSVLIFISWVTSATLQRQRAMAAEIADAEDDLDLSDSSAPTTEKVALALEIVALALTIVTFVWGVLLLLQRL